MLGHDDLTYYVPFAAAVLLVALGSDYNVFVAGRIWEEARRYAPARGDRGRDAGRRQGGHRRPGSRSRPQLRAAGDRPAALLPRVRVRDGGRRARRHVHRPLAAGPALTSLFGEAAWWPGRRTAPRGGGRPLRGGRGPGRDRDTQAESATHAALSTLAERITRNETRALATRLPRGLDGEIRRAAARSPERFGADEFVHRMADREGVPEDEARRHARAVLTTLEANAPDSLEYVRAQLSDDYDALFERRGPRADTPGPQGPLPDEPPDAEPRVRRETDPESATDPISTPGLSSPAGSTARFAARSAAANGVGALGVVPGRWSRPTRGGG